MSKASVTSVMILCAALAACTDGTATRTPTGPSARGDIGEAPADGFSYTVDGPLEAGFTSEGTPLPLAAASMLGAQLAASPQAASGSRASGHVGLLTGVPGSAITSEQYSFAAVGTDPATLAAKGQYEVMYTAPGSDIRIHGEVSCMIAFSGNTARAMGPITKVWRNGVQIPITANTHAFWVVVDNGEGAATPDQVSAVRFSNGTVAQNFCTNGFGSFVFPNQAGNIQVQP